MSRTRVVFLGTSQFAVISLKGLLSDEHFEIVGVVTQPDRPSGRNLVLTPSPVKQLAIAEGLTCLSPVKINQELVLEEIQSWKAEVAVVVAFGQILSQKFLDLFPFGAVNVHGSLLPKWRGAAPIQRAIEAGDEETGVCLQKIVRELDAGDVLGLRKLKLDANSSALQVHDQMAELGVNLLQVELMDYLRGNLAPTPQDHALATYAKKIEKQECEIDWKLSAAQIHNKVRAFQMGPGTYSHLKEKRIKIHKTQLSLATSAKIVAPDRAQNINAPFGRIVGLADEGLRVTCGSGTIDILELQIEGKNKMSPGSFLKTLSVAIGDTFAPSTDPSLK